MRAAVPATEVNVRTYRAEDLPGVLRLLEVSLGPGPAGERSASFFEWKHLRSPFGPSYLLVAEARGGIVGLRAFMRWRFRAGPGVVRAVRAVDTATHPDHRRTGLFTRLTREALGALAGEVDLVFNTPNDRSLPGYLKMGWRTVGTVPVSVRVSRPLRFARGLRRLRSPDQVGSVPPPVRAERAADVLGESGAVSPLLEEAAERDGRIATGRDLAYLGWRYGSAPVLDYRAVGEERGGRLRGLAIFRVRRRGSLWESTVAELIVPPADRRTAGALLRRVRRAAHVAHLTCHFPTGSAASRAARRAGFLRSPLGVTLAVNPLRDDLQPDPSAPSSWALSLGDLEVF